VKPGDVLDVGGVRVEAVPSYNVDKKFPSQEERLARLYRGDGRVRIYHAGDTDFIPEMKEFKVDIAMILCRDYVMTADQALKATLVMKPKLAIQCTTCHCGQ